MGNLAEVTLEIDAELKEQAESLCGKWSDFRSCVYLVLQGNGSSGAASV